LKYARASAFADEIDRVDVPRPLAYSRIGWSKSAGRARSSCCEVTMTAASAATIAFSA
jgi:hypothetical protein